MTYKNSLDALICHLKIFYTLFKNSSLLVRGANLSPFGEIRRFHLEIGHSRELCRSIKKKFGGGEGS